MEIFEWDESIPVTANNLNEMQNILGSNFQLKGKIIWTNPNPTSAFAAQTITLSSNDYDMYEVIFYGSITGADTLTTGKIPKGKNFFLQQIYNTGDGDVVRNRSIKYLSDTSVNVTDGTQSGITNNNTNIPVYIIGYKTGLF